MKTAEPNLPGANPRNEHSRFWELRKARATIQGLADSNGKFVATQVVIAHILHSLDDIEAALSSSNSVFRCVRCGVMIHDSQSIHFDCDRYCMECGTRKCAITESPDVEVLPQHTLMDIARQTMDHRCGLYQTYQPDHPLHDFWLRICSGEPVIAELWRDNYKRRTA